MTGKEADMNAIAEISCETAPREVMGISTQVAPALGIKDAGCGCNPEISASIKFQHGGARPGAGRKPNPPAVILPTFPYWCVVRTHPTSETRAAMELGWKQYRTYVPQIASMKRDPVVPSMFHKVVGPLFRGYIFLELEDRNWGAARDTPGVQSLLLGHNGQPAKVPNKFIDALMALDGERLNIKAQAKPVLAVGAKVKVVEGPMNSFYGMVLECDGVRTMVNVELFGRMVPAQMARADVEVVEA